MRIAIRWILPVVIAAILVATSATEFAHHRRFGHFVGYGLHADVVLGNSDVGINDMYYARLLNMSPIPSYLEGCMEMGTDSARISPHWDVQKWDPLNARWGSCWHSWVFAPSGHHPHQAPCLRAAIVFAPFQSRDVAWVFGPPGTTGEPVRMAIHTSVRKPPERQRMIFTDTFIVKPTAESVSEQR